MDDSPDLSLVSRPDDRFDAERDLIPARRINDFVYCPRRCYLEWVQCEWADSADTVEGRTIHRRVDVSGPLLPDPSEMLDEEPRPVLHARSVTLAAEDPGIIARMDLVEADGLDATPVDYKHGKKPDVSGGVWDADRFQLGAQAICLLANGFRCSKAVVYYAGSKDRVEFPVSESLLAEVRDICRRIREMARCNEPPPPLVDSPKCAGCSIVGICLPDEVQALQSGLVEMSDPSDSVRRLFPILGDNLPVYCQEQGGSIGKRDETLVVRVKGSEVCSVPLIQVSQVCVFGNVQVTTQTIHELCSRDIPICYFSTGGWFFGITHGFGNRNVLLRRHQFRRSDDPSFCLSLARRLVTAKIRNQRTMLRRNGTAVPTHVLSRLSELCEAAERCESLESILGVEGMAARLYFQHFSSMIRPRNTRDVLVFDMNGRNRRPPKDPINAMLSLTYALLAKDCGVVLSAVGLDPFLGFYHTAHHGRQSLSLDMMEEFRPVLADSVVISAINNGELQSSDFLRSAGSVCLKTGARKRLIEAYERRMDQSIIHPVFGYQVSYRKVLELQARLLARYIAGEIPDFPAVLIR